MKNILIPILIVTSILFLNCNNDESEPIRAITKINKFYTYPAQYKLNQVKPVQRECLYGNWTVIACFFTISEHQSVTTFGFEGSKYKIMEDGSLITKSVIDGEEREESSLNWELKSNNTKFDYAGESWFIRVKGDTMEWISPVDEDYMYYVLVK